MEWAHRGTFVGTAQYFSPEMLVNSSSGPFTDYWALGIILYQMINGKVPWKDISTNNAIFEQIKKGDISYPDDMPP